jgi:hypothetical protein
MARNEEAGRSKSDSDGEKPVAPDWREAFAESVKGVWIVGPPLAVLIRRGAWQLLGWIAIVVWLLVLYPLLLPILSAWMINAGALRGWHPAYAEQVRAAFRADEFADRLERANNERLDYFQVIEYDADASLEREYTLSVATNQRVAYLVEHADVYTENAHSCPIPSQLTSTGEKLFGLQFEDVEVHSIAYGRRQKRQLLTMEQWKSIASRVEPGRLTFRVVPVPALAKIRCGQVKVKLRVTFEIFKDLLSAPSTKAFTEGQP